MTMLLKHLSVGKALTLPKVRFLFDDSTRADDFDFAIKADAMHDLLMNDDVHRRSR